MSTIDDVLVDVAVSKRPFTAGELMAKGLSRMTLSRLVAEDRLTRPMRGVYRIPYEQEDRVQLDYAYLALLVPEAVMFGAAAAKFHSMTEGNVATPTFGIPRAVSPPNPHSFDLFPRFIRWRKERDWQVGVDTVSIENTPFKVTSRERTIVDVFRFSSFRKFGERLDLGIDNETFHDVLSCYLYDTDTRPDEMELRKIAKQFGIWEELSLLMETNRTAVARMTTT